MVEKLEAYYGLPNKVKFCKKCVISNQRPNSTVEMKNKNKKKETISFDENGVCSACGYNFEKKNFLYKIIFLTFPKRLLNFISKIVGSDKLPLNNHKNIYQLSNYKNSVIEMEKVFKKKFFECSSTKKYFIKNHSEKIFLKRFKELVRK